MERNGAAACGNPFRLITLPFAFHFATSLTHFAYFAHFACFDSLASLSDSTFSVLLPWP